MATGSRRLFTIVFTIVHYMIYSIFIIECFIVSVGGRDDNIAYLGGSQPAFAFGRQGRARFKFTILKHHHHHITWRRRKQASRASISEI